METTIINENYEGLIFQEDHLIYNGDYFIHNGDINIETDTVISIPLIIKGSVVINGNLACHCRLIVAGSIKVSGNLTAVRITAENISVNGDLHVTGDITCYRSVTVSGDVTAQNIDANYDLTCYRVTVRGSIKAETIVAKNQLNATSVRAGTIRTKQISPLKDLICVHLVTYPPIIVTREIDVVGGIYPPEESIY